MINVVVFVGVISVACFAYPMRVARECEGVMGRTGGGREEGCGRRVRAVIKELSTSMVRLALIVVLRLVVHRLAVLAGPVGGRMGPGSRENIVCVLVCVWILPIFSDLIPTRLSSVACIVWAISAVFDTPSAWPTVVTVSCGCRWQPYMPY